MPSYIKYFAGIEFRFEFDDDTWLSTFSRNTIPTEFLSAEYISSLVTHTYREDLAVKQAVLDALSPFQLMSKAWATKVLVEVLSKIRENDPEYPGHIYVTHIGSWFGQQATSLLESSEIRSSLAGHTLIDLDGTAMDIAKNCLRQYRGKDRADRLGYYRVGDIFEIVEGFQQGTKAWSVTEGIANVVMWTGIEHFDKEKVWALIRSSPSGTLWVLQGTDMPAPDHINPISSIADLIDWKEEVTDRHILYFAGTMECEYGARHTVAFLTQGKE